MENRIVITHFVNPHRFWYKPFWTDDRKKQQKILQNAIDDYCDRYHQDKYNGHYEPMLGEVVACYDPILERWSRCCVERIIVDGKELQKYHLWSIDEGMPKEVGHGHLKPLPERFQDKSTSTVKRGAVKNVIPAQYIFDPLTEQLCKRKSPNWSSFANATLQSFITGAQHIYFENLVSCAIGGETIEFGDLRFVSKTKSFNTIDVLSESRLGLIVEPRNFIVQISETEAFSSRHASSAFNASECPVGKVTSPLRAVKGTKTQNEDNFRSEISDYEFDESASMVAAPVPPVSSEKPQLNHVEPSRNMDSPNLGSAQLKDLAQPTGIAKKPCSLAQKLQLKSKKLLAESPPRATGSIVGAQSSTSGKTPSLISEIISNAQDIRNDPFSLTIDVGMSEQREFELMHPKQQPEQPPIKPMSEIGKPDPVPSINKSPTTTSSNEKRGNRLMNKIKLLQRDRQTTASQETTKSRYTGPGLGSSIFPAGVTITGVVKEERANSPSVPSVQSNAELKRFEKAIKAEKGIFSRRHHYRVLVHGQSIPKPIDSMASANFCSSVYWELERQGFSTLHRLQAYSWPHIMRGNSFICVNSAATGKTFAYLPAVCSLVQRQIEESLVPLGAGPVAIIICYTSREVQRISSFCRKLLHSEANSNLAVFECYGLRNVTNICNLLFNGCAILVTTAPCYRRLWERVPKAFDRKRIQTVVIDNMEEIMPRFAAELQLLCRNCDKEDLQMIVTAGHWMPVLASFFKRYSNMIVCIGAFMEAAVYAQAQFLLRLGRGTDRKQHELIRYIQERDYRCERTIVFGNDSDDLETIVEALRQNSINHVVCNEQTVIRQHDGFRNWDEHVRGEMIVFVCSDAVLGDLYISKAQHIIHFSLPPTWSTFTRRFVTSFGYYDCPYMPSTEADKGPPSSLVLLNEKNNQQLPKLIDFLELHKRQIPKEMTTLVQNIRSLQEHTRVTEGRAVSLLCTHVLTFAVCQNARTCVYRHWLTMTDVAPASVPRSGLIKMKICHVFSPTHFAVRLEALRSSNSTTWTLLNDSNRFLLHDISMQAYFSNEERHQMHGKVERNALCAVFHEQNYWRCQIINFEESKDMGLASTSDDSSSVQLLLIDCGQIVHTKSCNLLTLPDQFRALPAQAIDVRIAAVVPHDFEQDWDKTATNTVRRWIENFVTRANGHVQGRVLLALRSTIWVDELCWVEQLDGVMTSVTTEKIRANIISKQFGVGDQESFERIRQLVQECEAQWGGSVKEPAEEDTKTQARQENRQETLEKVLPLEGNQEDSGSVTDRVHISDTDGGELKDLPKSSSTALVPCVTPPDAVCTEVDNVFSSSSSIEHLSFTPNGENDQYEFESLFVGNTYNVVIGWYYSPCNFYVFQCDKMRNIVQRINEFVAEESNIVPLEEPHVDGYCLFLYENQYRRGRITELLKDNGEQWEVKVFFLDFGGTTVSKWSDLYVLPEQLLSGLPFSAIRGTIAHIVPRDNATEWDQDVADAIFDTVLEKYNLGSMLADVIRRLPWESDQRIEGCYWYELLLFDGNGTDRNDLMREIVYKNLAICMMSNEGESEVGVYDCGKPNGNDSDDEDDSFVQINFTHEEVKAIMRGLAEPRNGRSSETARIVEVTEEENPTEPSQAPPSTDQKSVVARSKIKPPKDRPSPVVLPRLQCDYRYPQTVWRQDDLNVILKVQAPDVARYDLEVDNSWLLLRFLLDYGTQRYLLPLNLFGPVKPQQTTHEIRGLMIVIRLVKLVPTVRWPTLLNHTGKLPWLREVILSGDGNDSGSDDAVTKNQWGDLLPTRMDSPCASDDSASSDEMDEQDLEEATEDDLFLARK